MEKKYAQRSKDISSKIKQELIAQSIFIENNAQLYLEINCISLDGNGKIITTKNNKKSISRKINFLSSDSIKASSDSTKKVGILVSCSHRRSGGGWLSGSMAQEESVSRATTWAVQARLFNDWYKQDDWLGQKGALVIDGLLFFNEKYEELKHSKKVVFAGVAAANKAALNNDTYWDSEKAVVERKNCLIDNLVCALAEFDKRGVEDVILCAFGTNVFGWKLEHSIEVLHEATKYASDKLNFLCAIGSEQKVKIAEEIYTNILSKDLQKAVSKRVL